MHLLRRFLTGFAWGLVGTVAMTLFMVFGENAGFAPQPTPIPSAIAARIASATAGTDALLPIALAVHFGIGGIAAGLYALVVRRSNAWKGLGVGVLLWLVLQLAILPWLGWGVFGLHVGASLWFTTLIAHVLYGLAVGALIDRREAPSLEPDSLEPRAGELHSARG